LVRLPLSQMEWLVIQANDLLSNAFTVRAPLEMLRRQYGGAPVDEAADGRGRVS
jgi:hypothetical protein